MAAMTTRGFANGFYFEFLKEKKLDKTMGKISVIAQTRLVGRRSVGGHYGSGNLNKLDINISTIC